MNEIGCVDGDDTMNSSYFTWDVKHNYESDDCDEDIVMPDSEQLELSRDFLRNCGPRPFGRQRENVSKTKTFFFNHRPTLPAPATKHVISHNEKINRIRDGKLNIFTHTSFKRNENTYGISIVLTDEEYEDDDEDVIRDMGLEWELYIIGESKKKERIQSKMNEMD